MRRGWRAPSDNRIGERQGRGGLSQHAHLWCARSFGAGGNGELVEPSPDTEQPLHDLFETCQNINVRNLLESYHDAQQSLDTAMSLFTSGYLPLDQRSAVENLYWAICRKICKLSKQLEFMPEELEGLEAVLSDTYFCNFSLFQSIPDSWAIKQLFPVMPIHRLNERPTRGLRTGRCDLRL